MGRVLYWDTEGNQKAAESYDMALAASGVTGYQVLASKGVGGYKDWLQKKEIRFRASRLRSAVPPVRSHFPNTSLSGIRIKQIPALFCKYIITHYREEGAAELDNTGSAAPFFPYYFSLKSRNAVRVQTS